MAWDFEYSNTQSFEAGDLTILDGLAELSIHCPVWLEDNAQRHHALGKGDSSDFVRFFFEPTGVNGKLRIPKLFIGIGGTTVRAEGGADDDFPYQTWCRFGGAFKTNLSTGIQVWIDGVKKGEGSTTAYSSGQTLANTATTFYVARRSSSPSETWDGKIGELALWDVMLEAAEFEALGAGLSALFVRPESLIFYSPMRGESATEWYWLPKAGTRADFTHSNGPVVAADDYPPSMAPLLEYRPAIPTAGAVTYGPFIKIADRVPSAYRDTMVQKDKAYKYKVRAKDTSQNLGAFSGEVTVTPTTGIAGTSRIPSRKKQLLRALEARRRRGRATMDPPT